MAVTLPPALVVPGSDRCSPSQSLSPDSRGEPLESRSAGVCCFCSDDRRRSAAGGAARWERLEGSARVGALSCPMACLGKIGGAPHHGGGPPPNPPPPRGFPSPRFF